MALLMTALKRSTNGGHSARKSIPQDVRVEYQRLYGASWEAKFSSPPDVKNADAKARFAEWLSEIETRITTLRAIKAGEGQPLTKLNALALAGEWYVWYVAKHQQADQSSEHWRTLSDVYFWDVLMAEAPQGFNELRPHERDWEWMKDADVRIKLRPLIAEEAQTALFLAHKGIVLNTDAHALFLDNVEDQFGDALSTLARRAQGDFSPDKKLKSFPLFAAAQHQTDGLRHWALFELWIAAARPADSTVNRWRVVFLALEDHFVNTNADALTAKDAKAWVDTLVTKERSAQTVSEVWLGAAKRVFNWAEEQDHVGLNPFATIKVTVPKKTKERETQSFTEEEWKIILRASLGLDKPKSTFEYAKRWVPWLCAYTGARPGEITQLRKSDVTKRGDVHVAKLSPSAGSIKGHTARSVPLHEHLVEQGFLDFVKSRPSGPLFYNVAEHEQPHDPTNPRRARSVKTRDRLGQWVRELGVIDEELSPNHAWRHTFKAQAERVGITEKVSDAITGHAPANVSRSYGKPTVADMAKAMEKFPRFSV